MACLLEQLRVDDPPTKEQLMVGEQELVTNKSVMTEAEGLMFKVTSRKLEPGVELLNTRHH